jgi:hypothetical protein
MCVLPARQAIIAQKTPLITQSVHARLGIIALWVQELVQIFHVRWDITTTILGREIYLTVYPVNLGHIVVLLVLHTRLGSVPRAGTAPEEHGRKDLQKSETALQMTHVFAHRTPQEDAASPESFALWARVSRHPVARDLTATLVSCRR